MQFMHEDLNCLKGACGNDMQEGLNSRLFRA